MASGPQTSTRRVFLSRLRLAVTCLGLTALASLCLEHGFDEPLLPVWVLLGVQLAAVGLYLATVVGTVATAPSARTAAWDLRLDLLLILVGIVILLLVVEVTQVSVLKTGTACVGAIQVLLVLRLLAGAIRWNLELSQKQLRPSRLLVTSFLVVILIGGSLLSLPKAMRPEIRAETGHYATQRVLNCFFTATSATCVTGLVMYDTGQDFTRFGQVVILVLLQIGGLGIMVFGSLCGLLVRKQLSLRQSLLLQDSLSHRTIGQIGSIIRFIVLITFVCEAIGAICLYPMFARTTETVGDCLFHCVFHAVSAFCNAGFALQPDSLVEYASGWGVYVSIMPLIVIGGLGFPVLEDIWRWIRGIVKPENVSPTQGAIMQPRVRRARPRPRLNLHTKLVLTSSVILIVLPAVMFFLFESVEWRSARQQQRAEALGQTHAMVDMTTFGRAKAALFQSVTARTAGFNTAATDVDSMSSASHFLLILLMFVGGSPASTAGGVKTVAVAVLIMGLINTLKGRGRVEAFKRTVPQEIVTRAAVVIVVMSSAVFVSALLLCYTESGSLREMLFESASACGTVGLSTGLTPRLTEVGRIIIMLAMFAGRLGPLTLLIALAGTKPPARYEYPPEHVVIG